MHFSQGAPSVRGRASEPGIIFRIPTSGQGVIYGTGRYFCILSSMAGFIFCIIDSKTYS